MKTVKFQVEQLTCPSCIKKIEGALSKQKGVEEAKVLFSSSKIKVVFHEEIITTEQLKNIIQKLGYVVLAFKVS